MIKINIVAVGNLKESFWVDAQKEYLKRLSKFAKVTVCEIPEKNHENSIQTTLLKESKDIIKNLKGYIILLDIKGEVCSSENFSKKIEKLSHTTSEITFVIGSSCGVDQSVKNQANEKLSFGPATFPHNLARIMLLEQVYRCFCISANSPYHK